MLLAVGSGLLWTFWHSFADALAWRIWYAWYSPQRKTVRDKLAFVFSQHSHCEFCHQPVPWYGLIPIAGYFLLHGHCQHCTRQLSLRFPVGEALAFVYGVILAWKGLTPADFILQLFVYALLWIIIFTDYHTLLIPTEAILGLLVAGLASTLWLRHPRWWQGENLLLGLDLASAFFWYFTFHLLRIASRYRLGLADVRLVLALGLLLGYPMALFLPGLAAFIGIGFWLVRRYSVLIQAPTGEKLPFGVFLAAAYWSLRLCC
ncbi:MAG: prepilin peptidase [Turneriella sp.]|nr:prepilin peptidase [Turneriella sp.]